MSSVPWPPPWGLAPPRHYGGYCTQITPAYTDAAAYTRSEDVFGDSYVVYEASASYTIRYQMPDESMLTVGERDRILTSYRTRCRPFWTARRRTSCRRRRP